ncbi:MAG: B12-binding domain-containing radical SAM protein [Candidatus Helarchaeota archaeon]|nr:B12-binding domain-containing radical SAM protein [Candidatus Helarchaeota archaeon]
MDILFINPRTELVSKPKIFYREPPNGILILCAILENAGFDVDFLDLSIKNPPKLDSYLSEDPKIVGITSLTNTYNYAINILKQVKKTSPGIITLYGGPHATFKYADILREEKNVDFILCGEADQTILHFMRTFFGPKSELNYSKVPNLAYRDAGKINFFDSYVPANLDDLPLPARHLLDLQNYQVGTIIVNRGCPFNCAFCVRQKIFQKVRFRNIPDIIYEMRILSQLGFGFVNLYDNLNIDEEYALKLCREIERSKIDLSWGCELRADRISLELAQALNKAGCKVIAVGVESGDLKVLQRVNKMQDLNMVKKGIKAAKSVGISIQAYFVVGLPGETKESFFKTLKFLDELDLEPGIDRVNFFAATPYPGTALYEHPSKFGIHILHENWDLYDNSHLLMQLNSIEFEQLERNFESGREIERKFTPLSDRRM